MSLFKRFLFELQEMSYMIYRIFFGIVKGPRYYSEIIRQMDYIGVGSLVIIILTGFFTGGVLILQAYPTFAYYGVQNEAGRGVATTLIRELGPVLTALMVSGRVGSSISAELGSMVVSQQIEAMRALGTSPVRKLVTPRITALLFSVPLLTVVADILGIVGGGIVATMVFGLDSDTYLTGVKAGVGVRDIIGGAIKPIFFALIIGIVACHKGLSTTGGTVGVGRSTTSAVVTSSIAIIIADFFLSKLLQALLGISTI